VSTPADGGGSKGLAPFDQHGRAQDADTAVLLRELQVYVSEELLDRALTHGLSLNYLLSFSGGHLRPGIKVISL